MKNINLKIPVIFALFSAAAAPGIFAASPDAEEGYKAVAQALSGYSGANGVKKIVVAGFTAGGGADKGEAEYAAGRIASQLARRSAPALVERAFFENVLRQARAAAAAKAPRERTKSLNGLLSVDAAVTGMVLAFGDNLKILAGLVDIKTGRLLFVTEGEVRRIKGMPPAQWGARRRGGTYTLSAELPGILVPDGPSRPEQAVRPGRGSDLRDAVADYQSSPDSGERAGSCAARKNGLSRLNAELSAERARYWADKMRAPGYSGPELGENPGGELASPGARARFYRLLAEYYKAGSSAAPDPRETSRVEGLIEKEKLFLAECGLP